MYIRLFRNINKVTQRKLNAVSGGRYTEAMKYSSVNIKRLMARSIVKEWNIHKFSGRTRVAKPEPAEANPTMVASCTALHTRSKTESRAKRISNRVTWSQVNQIIPKKQTYDHSAIHFISCSHSKHTVKAAATRSTPSKEFMSFEAVNVERFATKKRSKNSSIGVASACRYRRGGLSVLSRGDSIKGIRQGMYLERYNY